MADIFFSYSLELGRRESYVHAVVSEALDGVNASIAYIEGIASYFVRHDCSCLLIENHLDEPFAIWNAVAVAPRLGKHADGCIKVAVVEMKATPAGQQELKIHLSGENVMTVRIFEVEADAEAWFLV